MTDLAAEGQEDDTPTGPSSSVVSGTRHRYALRLLFILAGGSHETTTAIEAEVTHVFQSEKRLMAIDFLVRYPDYLADALLDQFEASGDSDLIDAADRIFIDDEPSVRTVSMVRWHFGAYQKIETALPKAFAFLETAVIQLPALAWYRDRLSSLCAWPRQRVDPSSKGGSMTMRNTAIPLAAASFPA